MDTQQKLVDFLCREFYNNDRSRLPTADQPLLSAEGGVIDSVGLHQLIVFLETDLNTPVDDLDIVPENFQNLRALTTYLNGKKKG